MSESRRLRNVLMFGDALAILIAFAATLARPGAGPAESRVLAVVAAVAIGLWAMRVRGLWDPRVIAMRWIELSGLSRAAGTLGLGMLVLGRVATSLGNAVDVVGACVVSLVLLVAWRTVHRAWVGHHRSNDRFTRRMIVLGTDRRAVELIRVFDVHPEAGVRVTGVIGSRREAVAAGLGSRWLGEHGDAERVLAATPSDGVVACSTGISPSLISRLTQEDRRGGRELLVHPGLSGIDARRVKASSVANVALLHVESRSLSSANARVKRLVDIVGSAAILLLTSPLFAFVALLVKRNDGGPVLFRQRRVGRDGGDFEMLKFRTMVVDAEARRAELAPNNHRSGPLFKLAADPRVTRIGRILRATSLDELPQLINVLKGEMSLVGPRPALRSEVDEFPVELHERHRVRPGITGLWQVEARDNPAFDAYQRLDLFYVENWSLALDAVIVLGTLEQLLVRPFVNRRRGEVATPAIAGMAAAA